LPNNFLKRCQNNSKCRGSEQPPARRRSQYQLDEALPWFQVMVLAHWFVPGGIRAGWRFTVLLWLALTGCLAHARFDFPFQVPSILLSFLLLCAVLSVVSRRS
jgi:hypothetical protein